MAILEFLNIIISVLIVMIIPGLFFSFVLFEKGKIDLIERITLSFALSISIVPLLTFYLNMAGAKITKVNVLLLIASIVVLSLFIIYLKQIRNKK